MPMSHNLIMQCYIALSPLFLLTSHQCESGHEFEDDPTWQKTGDTQRADI